jgi:hypothetical protein
VVHGRAENSIEFSVDMYTDFSKFSLVSQELYRATYVETVLDTVEGLDIDQPL